MNPLKKNIPEVQKTQEEDYRRRSSTFKPQRSLNHDHDQISQGRNSEGLHHKEDHSLPGMKIYFMVIIFIVLTLDIRLQIAGLMKEMFKQENIMWPHMTLNVTSAITMDT
jgi:hypothetical protein